MMNQISTPRFAFVTAELRPGVSHLLTDSIHHLRHAFLDAQQVIAFEAEAFVVLPDHFHAVLAMGDTRKAQAVAEAIQNAHQGRVGQDEWIWSDPRAHALAADKVDHAVAYCWANPIKHDYVDYALDWDFSSYHRDLRRGRADADLWNSIHPSEFGLFDMADMPATGRGA